jgi:hypothetical protein
MEMKRRRIKSKRLVSQILTIELIILIGYRVIGEFALLVPVQTKQFLSIT